MQFRTEVKITSLGRKISYRDSLFLMGSCFVENIGRRLENLKFNVQTNPFGVLFNPESIRLALLRMLEGRAFELSELFESEGVWNTFSLHSEFASLSSGEFLQRANDALHEGGFALRSAHRLFVTWGTAWIYRHVDGSVVANCHKHPASLFTRERMSVEAIVESYSSLFKRLWEENEALDIVLTVSPIRHWKDGANGNQLSKSVLLLAADELVRRYPDKVAYFPSYEIMMDDLRDYRFYASDMLHPSEQAVQYIWERFSESYFTEDTQALMADVERVVQAGCHRPFNPDSVPHQRFVAKTMATIELLEKEHPFLDFYTEKRALMQNSTD